MTSPTDTTADEGAFYSPGGQKGSSDIETRSVDEEEAANPTSLIPLSALGENVKEGDTVTVRVVKLYDDEAEVEVTSGKTEEEETPMKGQSMMDANRELESMDKQQQEY